MLLMGCNRFNLLIDAGCCEWEAVEWRRQMVY